MNSKQSILYNIPLSDTPTSGSETPVPAKPVERTLKLATPEKSPVKQPETTPS